MSSCIIGRFIRLFAGAVLVAGGLSGTANVYSSPGVGVDLSSIVVNEPLLPGGSYLLPTIGVINSGDEPREYEVTMHTVSDAVRDPDASWFHFEPDRFRLDAGQTRKVSIRLVVPSGAEPGDYMANLEAHPVPTAGQSIGIAVATELRFSVGQSGWLDTQVRRINRWLDDHSPWVYVVPVALLGLFIVRHYGARLPIRVRIERQ